MPDFLSMVERGLKAVRYGIFQASDNISLLLDGFCRAPEEQDDSYTYCGAQCPDWDTEVTCLKPRGHMFSHQCYETFWPLDSAASPQVAVVAPSPKQGSDSPPTDCSIPPLPVGGHPMREIRDALEDHRFRHASHDSIGSNAHCSCGFRPQDQSEWAFHAAIAVSERLPHPKRQK